MIGEKRHSLQEEEAHLIAKNKLSKKTLPKTKDVLVNDDGIISIDAILPLDGVHESWLPCFSQETSKPYYKALLRFIDTDMRRGLTIFPPTSQVFSWAKLCSTTDIRVVILGQDPYHDHGQAHGLAFSVQPGVKPPPSLRNIWKELKDDLGVVSTRGAGNGCLEGWAKQGVLLLNSALTVRAHQAASHSSLGWDKFTEAVIEFVSQNSSNLVFMLWGGHAQNRADKICKEKGHLILTSPHPSPLSARRGFFGCKHFSKANACLVESGKEPIDWSL